MMKNIILGLVLMLCVFGERGFANEVSFYNYGYAPVSPVIVNIPQVQTTWVPVSTVVSQPVVYYTTYVWTNPVVVNPSWGLVEKHRCFMWPPRYYYAPYQAYKY
jgi:hypothetical protein